MEKEKGKDPEILEKHKWQADLNSMSRNISNYFKLLRPSTLLAPFCGGLLFGLMAIKVANLPFSFHTIFLGCLSGILLACANAISNITNQVHDRDIDMLLPRKKNRPIPSGRVTVDEALSIIMILSMVTLSLAWYFLSSFYGATLTVILAFSWMYNSPPFRLKMKLGWSNLAIATPRGALGIIAAYSAFANPLDTRVLIPALAFGIYVFGANTFKDFEDCEGDKKMGVRNFCTVYGKQKASTIIIPFLFIPFFILLATGQTLFFVSVFLSCVMFALLMEDPTLKDRGVLMWKLFYIQFALTMFLYTLPYLLS